MAFPQDMVYVRWEFGWVPTGNTDVEIQDFGLWGIAAVDGPGPFPDWQDVVDAIAAKGVTSFATAYAAASFATPVIARQCLAYHYDQAHQEVLNRGQAVFDGDSAWRGSSDPAGPPQTALAISTYGFDPAVYATQPARKRGRFYLPTPGRVGLSADGELSSGQQAAILEQSQDFINGMTGSLDTGTLTRWRPYVTSVAGQMATKVTHLRVGRVLDTQRRRRNKLPETYVAGPINV